MIRFCNKERMKRNRKKKLRYKNRCNKTEEIKRMVMLRFEKKKKDFKRKSLKKKKERKKEKRKTKMKEKFKNE